MKIGCRDSEVGLYSIVLIAMDANFCIQLRTTKKDQLKFLDKKIKRTDDKFEWILMNPYTLLQIYK